MPREKMNIQQHEKGVFMKFLRKLITMVLAACMILTVSGIAALAANSSETATVTVTGLDENASIIFVTSFVLWCRVSRLPFQVRVY